MHKCSLSEWAQGYLILRGNRMEGFALVNFFNFLNVTYLTLSYFVGFLLLAFMARSALAYL